ncbi:PREDICTED: uncharacterized protein LOC109589087 [Amphimedon queenslandica]|nr:PREDICTED: uncharacterized protein LOC109589087 [Amphimedon queenslandica]|eukprot:XP_019860770.1 PREDICTED: uncharacterized protein LOC109589087 [Amphimedon queenslandica]
MIITGSTIVPLYEQCNISIVISNEAGSSEPFIQLFNTTASIFPTTATETPSSTRGTINDTNNYIIPVVVSTISVCIALVLVIILMVCAVIIVTKKKTEQVNGTSLIQTANKYQDFFELVNKVPITTSPVVSTDNRPIDDESPYHVDISEFLSRETIPSHIVEQSMQQQRVTTQEDSASSTASNNIYDPDDPAATVNTNDSTTHTDVVIAEKTDALTTLTNPPTAVTLEVIGHVNARKGHANFTSKDEQLTVEASECSEKEREEQALVTKQ